MTEICHRCHTNLDWIHARVWEETDTECPWFVDRPGNASDFIKDCCTPDPESRTTFADLWIHYVRWCHANRLEVCGRREFGNHLTHLGYRSFKGNRNVTYRRGLTLIPAS